MYHVLDINILKYFFSKSIKKILKYVPTPSLLAAYVQILSPVTYLKINRKIKFMNDFQRKK